MRDKEEAVRSITRRRKVMVESKAIPVVSDRQLSRIESIVIRLESIQEMLTDLKEWTEILSAELEVILGENKPDGYAEVERYKETDE